ncbi:MAG: cytochrome c oxidase subunit II [Deltaproteobacteria bacterium]|nr:cytochrome c oxidase subunit II [Deltaproteobacteria bacterium]
MDSLKELLAMKLPVLSFWSSMPEAASSYASEFDSLYYFLLWTGLGLFLLIVVPMCWFVMKYHRRDEHQKALSQRDYNYKLEVAWTFLPFIYLAVCFFWGFIGFLDVYTVPVNAKNLRVIGQKWNWTIQYPDEEISVSGQGVVVGVPVDENIIFTMSSQDVLHSFFLPNFRIKQDVLPGRYTTLWLKADKVGEFPIFCAEYCGDNHSNMLAKLKVMPRVEYDAWVDGIKNADISLSPKELGAKLYQTKVCVTCHTTDGTTKIGPSFKGLYGSIAELTSGKKVKVDDSFIKEHILTPSKTPIKGYPQVMPPFQGQLSEVEINALIEFIKSFK